MFVKMDIEGIEYELLLRLMLQGTLCTVVNHLVVEFHDRMAPMRSSSSTTLRTSNDAAVLREALTGAIKDGSKLGCNVKLLRMQAAHEEYLHDGVPFPHPEV